MYSCFTHFEGTRTDSDTRAPCPCPRAPPPLPRTGEVPSVTRTRTPPPGRSLNLQARGSAGSGRAASPTWGTPRWREARNFCFYIVWRETGPAPRCPPPARCPPEARRSAGDPCAGFITHDCGAIQPVDPAVRASLLPVPCVVALRRICGPAASPLTPWSFGGTSAIWLTDLTHRHWSATHAPFISAARQSVCGCFQATGAEQPVIGQAGHDRAVRFLTDENLRAQAELGIPKVKLMTLICDNSHLNHNYINVLNYKQIAWNVWYIV